MLYVDKVKSNNFFKILFFIRQMLIKKFNLFYNNINLLPLLTFETKPNYGHRFLYFISRINNVVYCFL